MTNKNENDNLTIALDPVALLGHMHNKIEKGETSVNLSIPKNEKINEEDADYSNDFAIAWI